MGMGSSILVLRFGVVSVSDGRGGGAKAGVSDLLPAIAADEVDSLAQSTGSSSMTAADASALGVLPNGPSVANLLPLNGPSV